MVLVLLVIHADRNTVRYLPYAMLKSHQKQKANYGYQRGKGKGRDKLGVWD